MLVSMATLAPLVVICSARRTGFMLCGLGSMRLLGGPFDLVSRVSKVGYGGL